MADKIASVVVGEMTSLQIKPTFEGVAVPVGKISFDGAASDLKGLATVNAFVAGPEGIVNVPIVGAAAGVEDITVVFKYADAGANANVEGWGKSTKTIALTVTEAVAQAEIDAANTTSELTMDLWEQKAFSFKVVKGENDILPSVTSVTVDNSIDGKFEFSETGGPDGEHFFKSISSSSTDPVVVDAVVTIAGTDSGTPYSLTTMIKLTTNVNDGSIPTNRFDVEFQ